MKPMQQNTNKIIFTFQATVRLKQVIHKLTANIKPCHKRLI